MAFNERQNNEELENNDDSGVFDIVFVENDEGSVVVTAQTVKKSEQEEIPTDETPAQEENEAPENEDDFLDIEEDTELEEFDPDIEELDGDADDEVSDSEDDLPLDGAEETDEGEGAEEEINEEEPAEEEIGEPETAKSEIKPVVEDFEELDDEPDDESEEAAEPVVNETEKKDNSPTLDDLKKTIDKTRSEAIWKNPSTKNDNKKVKKILGLSHNQLTVIIGAIFTIDALLMNFVVYWGIYYLVDRLLKLSGIAALHMQQSSYEVYSLTISYICSFILGGFALFVLMFFTKQLMKEVNTGDTNRFIQTVVIVALCLFLFISLIVFLVTKSVLTFTFYRVGSPLCMYLGASVIYALSKIKISQEF